MADDQITDPDVQRRSVTADETRLAKQNYMWVGNFMLPAPLISLSLELPAVGTRARDEQLFSTLQYEDKWANAVAIAATKCASFDYDIEGDVDRRRNAAHEILGRVDGMQGWAGFIAKHMQDFLCTDNGAFIEIVRASKSVGSKILGLLHLDSARCFRTGDPNIPVIYRDRLGQMHPMKAHEVIAIADMPNPRITYNGTGQCAASRVYKTLWRMAAIEASISEKVSGRRPQAVYMLTGGVTQPQINQIFTASQEEASRRGMLNFQGASVAALPTSETGDAQLITIPISGLPDDFDLEKERSNARLEYANAIGLDIQDLQPGAIGGSLGSSTQSEVLNEKSKGKGLAYWRKAFTEQMNLKVLASETTFVFVERDYRDDKQQAESEGAQMDNIVKAKNAGFIDAPAAVKIAIDKGLLPVGTVAPKPELVPQMGPDGKPLPVPAKGVAVAERDKPNVIAAGEKPVETAKGWGVADAFVDAFKANRTTAVRITPQTDGESAKAVTNALRGYMKALVSKCKELCPDDSGALRESIRYAIKDANTENAEAYLYIGNKARPEVVVRSNLYGRRGFGPKDEDGVLVFEGADGEPVFTQHVDASEANNWLDAAWKATASERRQLTRTIGALSVDKMDVRDVPLQNAEHIDGYDENRGETVPNTARNRGRGGL